MSFKITMKIMIVSLLLLLNYCSTTKLSHIACDFFEGILNILDGMFTRAVNDKESEPCT